MKSYKKLLYFGPHDKDFYEDMSMKKIAYNFTLLCGFPQSLFSLMGILLLKRQASEEGGILNVALGCFFSVPSVAHQQPAQSNCDFLVAL